jgi:hypothetical protein
MPGTLRNSSVSASALRRDSADQCRPTQGFAVWIVGQFAATLGVMNDAAPLLLRRLVVDGVLRAQGRVGGPVTSVVAMASCTKRVSANVRAFTELARRIAKLGPDEKGRVLHHAGEDRKGHWMWWVEEPSSGDSP